jgi:pyruvate/2-oxoglutarate dehydrogenase complex dihydrolipoamide acyltransferase (E2) component
MNEETRIFLERDNVNDEVVILVQRFVNSGAMVEAGTLIAEVETSKANLDVYAPRSGYLYWAFEERAEIPVSASIGVVLPGPVSESSLAGMFGDAPADAIAPLPAPIAASTGGELPTIRPSNHEPAESNSGTPEFPFSKALVQRFSRTAQELLRKHNIGVDRFSGLSLVRASDVLNLLHGPSIEPAANTQEIQPKNERDIDAGPGFRRIPTVPAKEVPLSRRKRSEIQSLEAGVRNTVPSAVSVTCLTHGLRTALEANPIVAGNLGAVVTFEAARLLRKYPTLNATYRPDSMLLYKRVNIGYAMDDGRGLKVSVIHDSDLKSLAEITAELRELTIGYLGDKLMPAQTTGGTFTISDLSGLGVASFQPLISEDQGAILGLGAEQFLPGSRDGLYTLSLTFDHHLAEGRTAALFLNDLKERLMHYERVLESGTEAELDVVCVRCGRGVKDFPDGNVFMIQSVIPAGHLCSLCLAGF